MKGILLTPKTTITERGGTRAVEGKLNMSPVEVLVNLWRHECERVFCDKLTTNKVHTAETKEEKWRRAHVRGLEEGFGEGGGSR